MKSKANIYPSLAGLCSMDRATTANWSVEASVDRLKRIHYVIKRLHEVLPPGLPPNRFMN